MVASLCAVVDVEGVHDVHAWSLSPEVVAVSAHLVIAGQPSLATAQAVAETAKAVLADRFAIAHATLELECSNCVDDDTDPCRLGAVATRPHPTDLGTTGTGIDARAVWPRDRARHGEVSQQQLATDANRYCCELASNYLGFKYGDRY